MPSSSDLSSSTSNRFSTAVFADLRVPLWAGGAISSAIEAADARVQLSQWQTENLKQQVKVTVLQSYAYALAADQQRQVADKALERSQQFLSLATSRRDTGVGLSSDVARAQLNVLRRQEDLLSQNSQQEVALAMLRASLLLDSSQPLSLTDSFDSLFAFQGQSYPEHPLVQQARAEQTATLSDLAVARSGYHPTAEVFANAQYGNGGFYSSSGGLGLIPEPGDGRFGYAAGSAAAGVMFTWKAFDMFVTRDKIAQADASNVAAGARLQQAQREVRSQLEQALVRERHAKQRVELLRDGSRIAREAVLLAKVRYETGNAILTEVLDAELEGTSIESRAVQAAYELAIAHVDRIQAEGRRL